jgi:pimeloyl-ACP methyl ester carboxylesterase
MPVYHTATGTVETLEWGEGPELFVLLHAAAAGPQSLSALAALLLRPGRRVIAPAFNRYGATVMRDETDRLRAHLDVLRACLEFHPAKRRVLFGHSMGGLVGLLGALDGLALDAMALYEPIVIGCLRNDVPEEARLRDWDRAILAEVERDPAAGIAAFVTAWNETPYTTLSANVRARLTAAAATLAADMRAVSLYQLPVDRIAQLRLPVSLVQGAQSPPITHAMTTRLATLLPRSRQVIVAGCGHMGPVQVPMAVAPLLP